ncbi:MAG: hypothetical protein QOK16_2945 [Solirubrobacteraceae bacterium]|jgi:hypothetical protein|nr:hypothetical protein [Solirubrobacteraceae bacterium]MEA2182492.1 hypothetical protein [Solirubrobacteraceae bacterium]MEA2187934.1 hypothetical protein [Solirubrobacteraceae bacterium]
MIRVRTISASAAACAVLLVCGCGDDAASARTPPPQRSITLTIRFDRGARVPLRGTLSCRPSAQRATGIARPAARSCSRVRRIAGLLTSKPREDRICTLIYGGPQKVRVTGRIGGKRVNRRFDRTNGCEIIDYDRLASALPRIRVR